MVVISSGGHQSDRWCILRGNAFLLFCHDTEGSFELKAALVLREKTDHLCTEDNFTISCGD